MDTGTKFERKFRSMLNKVGGWCYKFPDKKSFMRVQQSFIPKVPCDYLLVYKGLSFLFELKHTQEKSLSFKRVTYNQKASLLAHNKKGLGESYIVVLFKNFGIYLIDIEYFLKLEKKYKSLKLEHCKEWGIFIKSSNDLKEHVKVVTMSKCK